jgi:hypothetical protein
MTSRGEMDARMRGKFIPKNSQVSYQTYGLNYKPSPIHIHAGPPIGKAKGGTIPKEVTLPSLKFTKD